MDDFLQFLMSGLTRGAVYAIVGIGFAIIYNASKVVNFAQGEFVMIGGLVTSVLITQLGLPLPIAAALAVTCAAATGALVEYFAVDKAKNADPVTLIIITIGASTFIRGVAEIFAGRGDRMIPPFTGDEPISIGGAAIQPQSLWVIGTLIVLTIVLHLFMTRTLGGKAMLATSQNANAAKMVGINTRRVLLYSFAMSGVLGAIAGIVLTPITLTRFDIGVLLGLKGFCAAIIGGLTNPMGAVVGGLAVGLLEAFAGGYISSAYQDAVAFLVILFVLLVRPTGLVPVREVNRV